MTMYYKAPAKGDNVFKEGTFFSKAGCKEEDKIAPSPDTVPDGLSFIMDDCRADANYKLQLWECENTKTNIKCYKYEAGDTKCEGDAKLSIDVTVSDDGRIKCQP